MIYFVSHWSNLELKSLSEENEGVFYKEEWAEVKGYEGLYEISTFGRVKSLERVAYSKSGQIVGRKMDRILRQARQPRGETSVMFSKKGKTKRILVHILVGKHFIPNPENKRTINHKKGNPSDNRAWMLEWNTDAENNAHSFRELGRLPGRIGKVGALSPMFGKKGSLHPCYGKKFQRPHKRGANSHRSKPIKCDTLDISFVNIAEASKKIGISKVSIGKVLSGKLGHSLGLTFRYF